jgi:hypothetical protein
MSSTSSPIPESDKPASTDDVKEHGINEEPSVTVQDEATVLAEYNLLKTAANSSFAIGDMDAALTGYERALATLPTTRMYEAAVVRSNMAACHLRLEAWKTCVEVCGKGLDELDAMKSGSSSVGQDDEEDGVEEVVESDATAARLDDDVLRIKTKLLLRRARARGELGGWAELSGAQEGIFTFGHQFQVC